MNSYLPEGLLQFEKCWEIKVKIVTLIPYYKRLVPYLQKSRIHPMQVVKGEAVVIFTLD
jgi:hypothetical protein